eukprot:scaffold181751_cov22-Tisochrysis_lutea.AAC.1
MRSENDPDVQLVTRFRAPKVVLPPVWTAHLQGALKDEVHSLIVSCRFDKALEMRKCSRAAKVKRPTGRGGLN